MSLEDLRANIDDIDARLVKLLAERMSTARKIGALKRKGLKQVQDGAREKEVIEHVRRLAKKRASAPRTWNASIRWSWQLQRACRALR